MIMFAARVVLAGVCLSALGCVSSGRYTQTGPAQVPKAEGCPVQVLTTTPAEPYVEIGVIDVTAQAPTTIERFRKMATPHVCKAGGDAVIALANGAGYYIKGTVLKRAPESVSAAPQPPPPVVVAPPVAAEVGGCQFDTQCKGDRVCVDGKCTQPSAPSPAPAATP
jgi:hypothetical protein